MRAGNNLSSSARGEGGGGPGRFWRMEPPLARWSYAAGVIGALLAVHDFHHPHDSFGYSTPVLGVAIVLYLLSLRERSGSSRSR